MLVKTILNFCHKFNSFIYQNVTLQQDHQNPVIIVKIIARANGKKFCSICQRQCPGYDRLPPRRFQFIPIWGIPVFFQYAVRRVNCPIHGVVAEYLPWAKGKSHLTEVFKIYLSQWAKHLSWYKVAELFHVQWYHVFEAVKSIVEYGLQYRDLTNIKALGIDEIQYRLGHVYLTLVYQLDTHCRRLLYISKDRTTKSLLRFFRYFGTARNAALEVICCDMWKPYLKVIRKKAPQAINLLDRFHIMKKFNEAIDNTRRQEIKQLEHDGQEPLLKHSRWLLLKNKDNQKESELARLKVLLRYNLKSVKSLLLRDAFQKFWSYRTRYWAKKFFDQWLSRVNHSNLVELKKVAKTLQRHEELLFNWFKLNDHYSNSISEGFNNKAKLTIRKAFGFKQFETIEIALYHQLGDLPLPKLTHEFF